MDELRDCRLCPRACGVDRLSGALGFCRAGDVARVFRYGPHYGEEPPVSGECGSGTVFFSHCTLACLYCQNHPWSQGGAGETTDTPALTAILRGLAEQGCHNWNLVSPTPWLPQIRAAAAPLIRSGVRLPFVYNTSGFESTATLAAYRDLIDIALTDLRYADPATAQEGSGRADYVARAREALRWFWRELGPLETGPDGLARRGTICRLLVLPGREQEAIDNLEWLAGEVGTAIAVSVMSQYTPVHRATARPPWHRPVDAAEYARVTEAAERLGFEEGWIQPFEAPVAPDLLGCAMPAGSGAVGLVPTAPEALGGDPPLAGEKDRHERS